MRKRLVMWIASLAFVAGAWSALTLAQTPTPMSQVQAPATEPRIVSGGDLGFRVESIDPATGNPLGRLVIRVNGEWKEVSHGPFRRWLK
jgi:hypothetical protein